MDNLEELLQRADEDNVELRKKIWDQQKTIEWQSNVISEQVNTILEQRKTMREYEEEDRQLFKMMREHPEVSEGCIHRTISVAAKQTAAAEKQEWKEPKTGRRDERWIRALLWLGMIVTASAALILIRWCIR